MHKKRVGNGIDNMLKNLDLENGKRKHIYVLFAIKNMKHKKCLITLSVAIIVNQLTEGNLESMMSKEIVKDVLLSLR